MNSIRAVLENLRSHPGEFTDEELGEIAALAPELGKLAAHTFVERLLARERGEQS
jgi:hypothetical protein